jgi:hypothetical protein
LRTQPRRLLQDYRQLSAGSKQLVDVAADREIAEYSRLMPWLPLFGTVRGCPSSVRSEAERTLSSRHLRMSACIGLSYSIVG